MTETFERHRSNQIVTRIEMNKKFERLFKNKEGLK